jgi:hypothetical protein
MNTDDKIALIARSHAAAQARFARLRSVRELDIEGYVLLDGGCITRLKSRTIVFSVNGVKQKSFTGKWGNIVGKMLDYLDTRVADNGRDAA